MVGVNDYRNNVNQLIFGAPSLNIQNESELQTDRRSLVTAAVSSTNSATTVAPRIN